MDIKSSSDISQFNIKKGDLTVGILFPGYGYERVSYALPVEGVSYKRIYSLPIHRFLNKTTFYRNTPIVLPSKVEVIHTWNAIPITTKPFIITFELEIPRYFGEIKNWQRRLGFWLLRSKRCKGIYALSETAAELARVSMIELGEHKIANKISAFRGGVNLPVEELPSSISDQSVAFSQNKPIKVIFIGGDAFRKGFAPAFNGLAKLVEKGVSIELTFIGRFMGESYALKECSPDPTEWQKRIDETSWVKQINALPNHEVMALLKKSDVLLFPSFDESLGWVIVEAALLGVPSITTNIFAFPELVKHKKTGYVIPLNCGEQGRWQGVWETGERLREETKLANEQIEIGVIAALSAAYETPAVLQEWGKASCELHTELYDHNEAAAKLVKIYQKSVS